MAENEGMEGKDLALNEVLKEAFKQKMEADQKGEGNFVNPVLQIGGTTFELEVKQDEKDSKYKMHILGVHILTLDENNELQFNDGWEEALSSRIKECGDMISEQDGKDLIENLKQMDKEIQKENEQKAEEQKDEEDLSDDIEEKDKKEGKPKEEEKTEDKDKDKDEIARRYGVSPNQVVHISTGVRSKRVTDKDHFSGIAKWAEKYDDIFILPGKDEYSWETIGVDKEGKEEVINNRQQEGKNPDVTIKMENQNSSTKELEEVRPLAMYEIDKRTSYAIIRDSAGKTQAVLCRQEEGKGKEYWGQVIPEAQGKNVREASPESRKAISPEHYSAYDLAKRGKAFEYAKSFEERGYPSKEGKGVQMEEITGTPAQNRQLLKEAIINDLVDRAIAASPMPINRNAYINIHKEELNNKAEKILTMGEEHDDISYEDALKRLESESKEKEKDQKTPDQNPRKRQY